MLGEEKDWDRGASQRGASFLGRDLTVLSTHRNSLRGELETVMGQGQARPHADLDCPATHSPCCLFKTKYHVWTSKVDLEGPWTSLFLFSMLSLLSDIWPRVLGLPAPKLSP